VLADRMSTPWAIPDQITTPTTCGAYAEPAPDPEGYVVGPHRGGLDLVQPSRF
jgi:hypothetical protein